MTSRLRIGTLILPLLAGFIFLLASSLPGQSKADPGPAGMIKVACVGDSITFGSGLPDRERTTYPKLLGHLLGDGFEVRNFGVSGATMLLNGNKPWLKTEQAKLAMEWRPDIVVIKLGTNDSKEGNLSKYEKRFEGDTRALVDQFQLKNSQVRILLCTPVPAWTEGKSIDKTRIAKKVVPAVRQAASVIGCELLDLHTPFQGRKGWFPDGVHPNPHGAEAIARHVWATVIAEQDSEYSLKNMLHFMSTSIEVGDFHCYEEYRFANGGAECRVVFPRVAAKGRPWIWRARFWGHQPQFDVAMLDRGWHVVYSDVSSLFGGPEAMRRWNGIYELLTKSGLNSRPLLEGMSRGGLAIYQWAKAYPDRVMGIYGDNPVLNPRSWPGGSGASMRQDKEWKQCSLAYGLDDTSKGAAPIGTTGAQIPFEGFALQGLEQLAAAKIPILHVIGEADSIVPVAENSDVVEKRYLELGGNIKVIRKPGMEHHPHSLANPQPIIDFALRAAELEINPCIRPQPSSEWRGNAAGWGGGTWWQQHEKINALATMNPDLDVIFLGDSITQSFTGAADRIAHADGARTFDQFYGSRRAASFGISGDRVENLLWRIDHGNFDPIDPRLIVLMIGVNNINAGNDGDSVAAGIEAVVQKLRTREPQAEILLLGCFPTNKAGSWARRQSEILHELIAPLGNLRGVRYQDLRRIFVQADGKLNSKTMRGDGVHITEAGYQRWAEAIEPTIREILAEEVQQEIQPEWLKSAARIAPSPRQLAWQELDLTCFIHFGINTFTDREWGTGKEAPALFNPSALDIEQWVLTAKAGGMKLMLLTAKHHDGFCLWPSRYTPHSVASSPFQNGKGDVVRELANACRKHGLKLGIYLSPADLNAIERKGYGDGSEAKDCVIPTPVPNRPFAVGSPIFEHKLDTYNQFFMNQLYETLTEYGEIDEVWFDGANPKPGTGQTYDREAWYSLIRTLQPQAVIAIDGPDVRWIGNEAGHARATGEWSVIPMTAPTSKQQIRVKMKDNPTKADLGSRNALKSSIEDGAELRWYPAEMNTSIRGGWFYHAHEDGHSKASVERLLHLFDTGYGGNAVLLLNVSPDRRGLIHEEDARRLAEFGEIVKQTFDRNLAQGAVAIASDQMLDHLPANATDGNPSTWWQPNEGINRATIEFQLGSPALFNLINLREAITQGQRIESYFVEAWTGNGWTWIGQGGAVGNRNILRVAETTTSKIRLHITSSRLCPTLSHFALHLAPVRLITPTISRDRNGMVTIAAPTGAGIRYTLDGQKPSAESKLYAAPFAVQGKGIVKARCFDLNQPTRLGQTSTMAFDLAKTKWRIHAVSSEQADSGEAAAAAIDGDLKTLWHSRWRPDSPIHPHWLIVDLGEKVSLSGFTYTPRSDASRNGTLLSYRFELSLDGENWKVAAEGEFENMVNNPTQRRVDFSEAYQARYIRLTALSEIGGEVWASVAEIGIVTD